MLHLFLLACTQAPAPEVTHAPQPAAPRIPDPAPPPRAPDDRFVLGSSLNLRLEPGGTVIGKLSINSPVTVLETKDDWTRVKVGNGKEGWVGSDFLAPEPVTVEEATAKARETGELSWWQRAAAIAPEREVLEGLAAAYRRADDEGAAARVDQQLAWPRQLLLAWEPWNEQPPGRTVVEWSRVGYGLQLPATLPKAAWRRYGLEADDVFFVLPSQGPAVQATAMRLTNDAPNDCSGEWSRNLWLEHPPFPDGVVALAAWRGRPPASWNSTSEPKATRAEAETAILGKVPLKGAVQVRIGPSGEDWVGFARVPNGQYGELGNELYDEVAVRWTPEGVEVGEVHTAAVDLRILGERDLVGSRQTLRVQTDGCENAALDPEGLQVHSTLYRCCGC